MKLKKTFSLLLLLVVFLQLCVGYRHHHHHHRRHHEDEHESEDVTDNEELDDEGVSEWSEEEMSDGNQLDLQLEEGTDFFSLPLKKAFISQQHAHHLTSYQKRDFDPASNIPLEGDVNRFGIFYIEVGVGTPPRNFKVIFDTGGWNFLLINRNCTTCGEVRHYRPSLSSTDRRLWCNELGVCRCSKSNKCLSHHHFGGGQDFIAQVYEDRVHFANLETPALLSAIKLKTTRRFAFPPGIDGLMGFGYFSPSAHPTVFQRLVNSGKVKDIFSTCLGRNGGVLTLGGIDQRLYKRGSEIEWSPLKKKRWYVVTVTDMEIGRESLGLPPSAYAKRHAIVDSGTTFLYVPEAAFDRIISFLRSECRTKRLPGICDGRLENLFKCAKGVLMTKEERDLFPNITVVLKNDVRLNLPNYLYIYPTEPIVTEPNSRVRYCMSVQQARDKKEVVIGSVLLQEYYTIYDRENQRVGFAPVDNCF
eukprot:TRINITY_DN69_c0_g1_i1.p1 TRINITY_DN69_c0_g1~~TRINITY_DN69_c0_g1_i1.p1  ORF type:complete len:474 (-),score=110.02 TRINITY_DN69_c0_g1_i1:165-1586(-)